MVCTSTLDLGIDWGEVDLVINVGAPKGASRLAQRIGRANHRLDEPSKALLVPANRFEVVECQAALEAAEEGAQDTPPSRPGALDVLAQHVLGTACAAPFDPDQLYREVTSAAPYQGLLRQGFDQVVQFVATGGYALANYERYAKLKKTPEGGYRVAHPRIAQQYRLNVGTIVEAPMVRVRLARLKGGALKPSSMLAGGRVLGEVEEYFIEQLTPGDTFVFAGEVLRFEGLRETDAIVTRAHATEPKVPAYEGGKFPLSTYLAERVRNMLADPDTLVAAPRPGLGLAAAPGRALGGARTRRGPGRDLPARAEALSRLLPVRRAAGASKPRHAADAAAGAGAGGAARFRRQRICAGHLGAQRHGRDGEGRAASTSRNSSTKTCSATISMPGSPSRA